MTLPPLSGDWGAPSVSSATTSTRDGSIPNVSAAMTWNAPVVPLMSTTPVVIVIEPSALSRHSAAAGALPPGQTPNATPTPSSAGRS